jgi:signal transduction histidine kinase
VTRRLLLGYLTVTVFVLVLLQVPLAVFFQQREMERLTADLERDAAVLGSIYEDALETNTPLDPAPADRYRTETGARVVVVDTSGIARVDTDDVTGRDFSTRPEFVIALGGSRDTGSRFSTTLNTELVYVAVPIASGGVVHGALRLTFDSHEVTERVQRFWLGLAAVAIVVLAAVAAVGWAVARSVTRPIRGLQETAARFAGGDLAIAEPEPGAPGELRDLQTAMNTMAQRLDRLLREQRAFVADASHQLRTPLTALRLRLENLQMQSDGTADAAELDAAVAEIDRLTELVQSLLVLARAEQAPSPTPQDLAALVRDRVDTWSAVADAEAIALRSEGASGSCIVRAVPGGIEQVLDNLIDNAVAAIVGSRDPHGSESAGHGDVGVVAIRRDAAPASTGVVLLEVGDSGPGLDDAAKAVALSRFWRAGTGAGTGLGLAIVDQIARASGGSVELTDSPSGGLSVRVRLPLAIGTTT